MFLRQRDRSSGDSKSHFYQGGLWYLSHSLQWYKFNYLGIPSEISIEDFKQLMHVFDSFGAVIIPH